jgi:putative methyltransferase (TIGR04325 family)
MMGGLARRLEPWLPPVLLKALQRPAGADSRYTGNYASWESALADGDGYDARLILERVRAATARVESGAAAYERDSVTFDEVQISWPVLSALLWAGAMNGGRLSVLDFGGSLGTMYRQNRAFLDRLEEVRWGVVEQRHFVACGREQFTTDTLRFFETIRECVEAIQPTTILLGSVLQYLSDPYAALDELDESQAKVMIVDKTPFSTAATDQITIQHVPASIYPAAYPARILSEQRFRKHVASRWRIAASYDCVEGSDVTSTGLRMTFKGFILSR